MIVTHLIFKLSNLVLILGNKPKNKKAFPRQSCFIPILLHPCFFLIEKPQKAYNTIKKFCVYNKNEHQKNFRKLRLLWAQINKRKNLFEFEYWFFTKASCIFHVRSILNKIFQVPWSTVYLPKSLSRTNWQEEFQIALLNYEIKKYCVNKKTNIKFYDEEINNSKSFKDSVLLFFWIRLYNKVLQKLIFLRSKINTQKVLLHLQFPKQLFLLKTLAKKYNCKQLFLPLINIQGYEDKNYQKMFFNLLTKAKNDYKKNTASFLSKVTKNKEAFFTDGEALPSVRFLLPVLLKNKIKIFTVPEGAQTVSKKLFSYAFFWWSKNLINSFHFVTSQYDQSIYKNKLCRKKTYISGYFGGSMNFICLSKKFAKKLFFIFSKKASFKYPNVVFAVYGAADTGSQWFTLPTQQQQFIAHYDVLKACRNKNLNCICIFQDIMTHRLYSQLFPDFIHIPPFIPWQLVERFCDILVVRDSSLVLEFLSRNCPVICFENLNLDTIVEKLKAVKSKNLYFLKKENLQKKILNVLRSKRDSYYKFEKYFRPSSLTEKFI